MVLPNHTLPRAAPSVPHHFCEQLHIMLFLIIVHFRKSFCEEMSHAWSLWGFPIAHLTRHVYNINTYIIGVLGLYFMFGFGKGGRKRQLKITGENPQGGCWVGAKPSQRV